MIRQFFPAANKLDFNLLLPAYLQLVNSSEALKFLSYTGLPFTEAQVTGWFKSHGEEGVDYFVECTPSGTVEGIATVKSNPQTGFELLGLVVNTTRRNSGIGKNLVMHILSLAQERGYMAVDVTVFADNLPMLRLVLGQGFIPVSMTHHVRYDGADVVVLKRYLSTV